MSDDSLVVLVDMDGVLADFDRRIVELLAPTCPGLHTDRTDFYFKQAFPRYAAEIGDVTVETGFFSSLPLVAGALEGWERIRRAGFAPRICSAPPAHSLTCVAEKKAWLEEHFGGDVSDAAIIDSNKWAHHGIALIDDRPMIPRTAEASWQHIVFDASYNRAMTDGPRLTGWTDPNLEGLLDQARIHYQALRTGIQITPTADAGETCWLGKHDPQFRDDYPPAFPDE